MRAFITGSQLYGKPTPKSDIDLVVMVDYGDLCLLKSKADKIVEDSQGSAGGPGSASMMFGKLNLLATTEEDAFAVWKLGTTKCINKARKKGLKPITRKEAVAIFSKMRRIYLGEKEDQ